MMSPDFYKKWAHILQDVEKSKIPIDFVKKIIIRLEERKQHTVNVEKLFKKGLTIEQIETIVNVKLTELDSVLIGIEFVLNVDTIAEVVQPETDKLLNGL
jgi:hypothetical protein